MKKILVISLMIMFTFGIAACSQRSRKGKQVENISSATEATAAGGTVEQDVEQKVSTFLLTRYTTGGAKEWEVRGDSAKIFIKDNRVKLDDMVARVWGDGGNCVTLSSDIGSFNRVSEDAHFEKNVIVTAEDGAQLRTDYLDWHPHGQGQYKSQLISTDAYVQIERENLKAEGVGLRAKHELNNVQLNKEVKVRVEGEELIVITCDGPLEIDYKASIAQFNKNVKVNSQRGELFADKMDVFIDKEKKSITKIICTGNVRINQGGNNTFSQRAIYLAEENKVILTGEPKLVICPGEMGEGLMFGEKQGLK